MLRCIFNVPLDAHSGMKKACWEEVRRKCSFFHKRVHYPKQELKVHMIGVDIIEPDGTRMVENQKPQKRYQVKK